MNDSPGNRRNAEPSPFLPVERLTALASALADEYGRAQPYPHIVIDGLFDAALVDAVLNEFPAPRGSNWITYDNAEEIKLESKDELDIPAFTRQFFHALNSATFIKFLERLTGIEKLIGDPHFDGAGLHQILPGGKLAIHADFSRSPRYNLERRLNLILYLNKNWEDAFGGHFELWNQDMAHRVKRVAPIFNRTLIFTTTRHSYHGHPDPLRCPPGMTRKSMALYYYTNGAAPREDGQAGHGTLFRRRPGERFRPTAKQIARDLMPPLLWRVISGARREIRK